MARVKPGESHSYAEYDPNYERSLREEWREMNPFNRGKSVRTKHEIWWGKSSYFAGVGFIAFIVWIASLLLESMIPAKWKVITWIIGAIGFVGKWVFFICAGLIILLFVIGLFFKFSDWLKNTKW
jgi:hypothetical protein